MPQPTIPQEATGGKPLVSFIVTTYNLPSDLLSACLDSILSLSLSQSEREIILVDDGSLCSPIDQLQAYRDQLIYVRQANQGLSAARNTGLRVAQGSYIQFVDGDDALLPVAYEHCLDLVRYHCPDIVMFEATASQTAAAVFTQQGPVAGTDFLRGHNLRASAWGYVFRRSILGSLRFITGILHEDEAFTPMLFLRAERLFTTTAKAYFYRQRPGSICRSTEPKATDRRLADTERVITHLQAQLDALPEADKAALSRRIAQLTMDYLYNTLLAPDAQQRLEAAIDRLSQKGLYPLPPADYTGKYRLFRLAIGSGVARKLLPKLLKIGK